MAADDLKLFEVYLSSIEKVSDRRAQANAWFLSIASALTGLHGLLKVDSGLSSDQMRALVWTIPVAGIIVAVAWMALLLSYRQLNSAKFEVLAELEKGFAQQPFARERTLYKAARRISFTHIETVVPVAFALLFAVELIAR